MDSPYLMMTTTAMNGQLHNITTATDYGLDSMLALVGRPFLGDDMGDLVTGLTKAAASLVLIVLAVVVSLWQKLGLEWDMVWSIFRAFTQLAAIGFVLNFIFRQDGPVGYLCIFLAFCFMVTIAGYTAGNRAKGVPHAHIIAGIAIFCTCLLCLALLVLLRVFPITPRYIIPVSGMIVGNSMTVTGVALKRLREDLRLQYKLIEAALALGATPQQAILKNVRRSQQLALAPVLDNAKTVGLISLPGAMTGLIMGGASPFEASSLQIVVMVFLVSAGTLSSVSATMMAWRFFFTPTYQIREDVLLAVEKKEESWFSKAGKQLGKLPMFSFWRRSET
eukprot:TRINITY_DN38423_c0_g1_i1.p1 TRINITY_DN38423_c0_g1~~TRINITY_DN38423_c0_g1_i1.p1  ORF type:complete len:335 (+),score=79.52 TRINITY_DN38423_c0_g1_i1:1141-2145(+)